MSFGQQGPLRTNANLKWEAQAAANWPDLFFEDDLNFKHADANGDGVINRADRGSILENYGLTHSPLPVFPEVPVNQNDPPLYVDFEASTAPIPVGGTFQVPIIFGTEARPVKDIYGKVILASAGLKTDWHFVFIQPTSNSCLNSVWPFSLVSGL